MKKINFYLLVSLVFILISKAFSQDTTFFLFLKKGGVIRGNILQANDSTILFKNIEGGTLLINLEDIREKGYSVNNARNIKSKNSNEINIHSGFTGYLGLLFAPPMKGLPSSNIGPGGDIALGYKFNDNFALLGRFDFSIYLEEKPDILFTKATYSSALYKGLLEFQAGYLISEIGSNPIYGFGFLDVGIGGYHVEHSDNTPSGFAFETGGALGFAIPPKGGILFKIGYGALNAGGIQYSHVLFSADVHYIP